MVKEILAITIFITSISALLASEFNVTSHPAGAEVFVKSPSQNKLTSLGKTPLKIPIADIINKYGTGPSFVAEIVKEGFDPYNILITHMGSTDINLKINLQIARNIKITKKFDFIMSSMFEAQRLMRNKDYKGAVGILDPLARKYPYFSTIFELKGIAWYLQKDFNKSLSNYRKAFSVNHENNDAYSVMLYLEKALGVKK